MPRKGEVPKRRLQPDPKFTDQQMDLRRRITKFVNTVMSSGKKSVAERIVYGAFDIVAEKAKEDPVKVWDRALSNVQPKLEVKSRRVGGATYQVPVDVRPDRAMTLGMRWLIHAARERSDGRTMQERLEPRFRGKEARRYAQDGRGQQGLCPLSVVGREGRFVA
jgi:small subunit ribosomal protein S7